jgi:hypothetical protein
MQERFNLGCTDLQVYFQWMFGHMARCMWCNEAARHGVPAAASNHQLASKLTVRDAKIFRWSLAAGVSLCKIA